MAPLPSMQLLSERNFHLGIATWRGRVESSNNTVDVAAQDGPLGVSKDDYGNFPGGQVLLMPHVFVGSHKYFEGRGLGGIE
jgi:hypothetical protein